jgi:23S rRNA pseudouridine1911/1915/1917 synthase
VVSRPPSPAIIGPLRGTPASAAIVLEVPPALAGERLDRALTAMLEGSPHATSRAEVQRWIEGGHVTIDGAVATVKQRARAGARIEAHPPAPPPSAAIPQDIPLTILFEDADLLVIDKPAGLVVHPAAGHADGTLVNAVLHHVRGDESPGEEVELPGDLSRPGVVHRLDRDTSGVMVVTKTRVAREALMARFAAHDLERSYLAIVVGEHPASATYDTLHGRHPRDRKRFTSRVTRGRRAVTHVVRVEALEGATLVRCTLETGRTHQIRVHLAEAGLPVLGDAVYGKPPRDPQLRAIGAALGRQALHASVLGFPHPTTGAPLRFESKLPADVQRALDALRARR